MLKFISKSGNCSGIFSKSLLGRVNVMRISTIPLIPFEYEGSKDTHRYLLLKSSNTLLPFQQYFLSLSETQLKTSNKVAHFYSPAPGHVSSVGIPIATNYSNKAVHALKAEKIREKEFLIESSQKIPRMKIVGLKELEKDIFIADCLAYKDKEMSEIEKKYNLQSDLMFLRYYSTSMKRFGKDISHEFDFSSLNMYDLQSHEIDKIIYKVAENTLFPKDADKSIFLQELLETKSVVSRVIMLKSKVQEVLGALDILEKKFKHTEEQIMKYNTVLKARQTIDSIKNTHFETEKAPLDETKQVKDFLEKLEMIQDPENKEKIYREIERFSFLDKYSSEHSKLYTYLDEVFSIPWNKKADTIWSFQRTKEILDKRMCGMEKVKERILEVIAMKKLNPENKDKGFIIMLYGSPGTGKTSVAKAIAEALNKPFRLVSFAGVNDVAYIKGHRRTYVDSQPGIFIKELIKAKVMDPVFVVDEVDKLNAFKGSNPYYSLMEIFNPDENANFVDHYLELKVDFSKSIFILTANDILHMLEPLLNRLEIIHINPYIEEEKIAIAQSHLLPIVKEEAGIKDSNFEISNEILSKIIAGWCFYEGGVRELKRSLSKIIRKFIFKHQKVALENVANLPQLDIPQFNNKASLVEYLGPPKMSTYEDQKLTQPPPGVANILSVRGFLGVVSSVECEFDSFAKVLEKKGQITYTGNLETVLSESITVAKINAHRYFSEETFKELFGSNVHFHFLDGAVKKDGPSAGITITTAYLSLLLNIEIPANIGMTGEISLNGSVGKIGGLHAKLAAAKSHKLKTIFAPYGNMNDAFELPIELKRGLDLYFVREYSQIYEFIFEGKTNLIKDKILDGIVYSKEENEILGESEICIELS